MGRILRLICVPLCVALCLSWPANAQVTTGSISGVVSDASGAVVAGVTIVIQNVGTNSSRMVKTDAAGLYLASDLPVGLYKVTAEMQGFATVTKTGINLTVGAANVQNFVLNVGSATEIVEVAANATQVQVASSQLGALVDQQQISELPLNGRDVEQLILLAPGVESITAGSSSSFYGRENSYSMAGTRPEGQATLIDGADVQNFWGHGMGATIVGTSLGVGSIAEFQTLTNTYSAEFGGAGSVINAVTKSGTNQWHGSAYEYLRNSVLDARNYFDLPNGPPPFRRNQFGGTLGGPIKRDSNFVFVNYEGLRQALAQTVTATVPDANARQGYLPCGVALDVACNEATGLADVGVNPLMTSALALFPPANGAEIGGGAANLITVSNEPINEDYFVARIDQNLGGKDSLFGRVIHDSANMVSPYPSGFGIPGWPETDLAHDTYVTLEEKHVASQHLLNVLRFSFIRTDEAASTPINPNSPLQVFPGEGRVDTILSVTGLGAYGTGLGPSALEPFDQTQNKFVPEDQVYWTHGSHDFRFGGSINRLQNNENMPLWEGGFWDFFSVEAFLRDQPGFFQGPLAGHGDANRYFREIDFAAYFQDNWRVRRNLTLNLGVRYEPTTNPVAVGSQLEAVIDPATSTGFTPVSNVFAQNPSLKNIEPRIGLAYSPFGDNRTVIRAGFGIFHDLLQCRNWSASYNLGAPNYEMEMEAGPGTEFPYAFTSVIPALPSSYNAMGYTVHNTPYYDQWNLNIERQLSSGVVVNVAYVGGNGVHLLGTRDLNPAVGQLQSAGVWYFPNANNHLNSNFSTWDAVVAEFSSNYNSLQLSVKGHPAKGLQLQFYYTWSKTMDDGSNSTSMEFVTGSTNQANPYDPRYDYGRSSFDLPNSLSGNVIYDLPFKGNRWNEGYQVSLIPSVYSGNPFSADTGWDSANQGDPTLEERPDQISNPNVGGVVAANPSPACHVLLGQVSNGVVGAAPATVHTAANWFNPCAFATPALGYLGNEMRNSLRGPAYVDFDMSLSKSTTINERLKAQFRVEAFNMFNHANMLIPNTLNVFSEGSTVPVSNAGEIISTGNSTSRQLQFAVKFLF